MLLKNSINITKAKEFLKKKYNAIRFDHHNGNKDDEFLMFESYGKRMFLQFNDSNDVDGTEYIKGKIYKELSGPSWWEIIGDIREMYFNEEMMEIVNE